MSKLRVVTFAILLLLLVVAVGCTVSSDQGAIDKAVSATLIAAQPATAAATPAPTATATSGFSTPKLEPTPGAPLYAPTPQEFREYVDPNGRFSMRIPNRWTVNEELVRELNADLNKTLADGGVVDDISESDSSRVEINFFAGYTLQGDGFDPNIVVMTEDLMTKMSTSQYWSNQLEVIPSEQSDPSENYTIGIGRGNGLVVQSAYNESDILKGSPNYIVEDIVLYSTGFTGEVGWWVGCSFTEFTPRGSEDECRHVIHSFRLLK